MQDEKGNVHNDQGQQYFSLIHMHVYACIYICAKRRAKERQTNLAYMMIDNGGDS